jgi:hypothetical protein
LARSFTYNFDGGLIILRAASLALAGILLSASAAFAAEPMALSDIQATFFDGKPFTASTTSGTQFKMIFTADGKMTRQPRGKSGKIKLWHLETGRLGLLHELEGG